jgi:hypothetical protein
MPQVDAAAAPARGQLGEAVAHLEGHRDRRSGVILYRLGVVQERHDPVARVVLDRAAMLEDEAAHHELVVAKDLEDLFGLGSLGERGESPDIAEDGRDVAPMGREQPSAVGG